MRAETLKGHLDGLLSAVLEAGPLHGYAVIQAIRPAAAAAFPASADALARWDVGAGREYRPFLGILPRGASPWAAAPERQFVAVCFTQAVVLGPLTGISRVDVPAHGAPIHRGDVYRIRRPPVS